MVRKKTRHSRALKSKWRSSTMTLSGLAILMVASGVVFFFWPFSLQQTQPPSQRQSFKKLENKLRQANSAVFESETASWLESEQWDQISKRLVGENNLTKEKVCRDLLMIFSQNEGKKKFAQQGPPLIASLYKMLKDADPKAKGRTASAQNLCAKTLSQLPTEHSSHSKKLVSLMVTSPSPVIELRLAEDILSWKPVPEIAKKHFFKKLKVLKSSDSKSYIQLVSKILDSEFRKQAVEELARNFLDYKPSLQPMIFKMLVLNKRYIESEFQKVLSIVKKQQSRTWYDAYLFALEKDLNLTNSAEVRNLKSLLKDPFLKQRVKALEHRLVAKRNQE